MSDEAAVLKVREPSARYIVQCDSILIRRFELLATAYGSVIKLRALIHSLAVYELLLPHDDKDQPAHALVNDIRSAKDQLIAEGNLRPDKDSGHVAEANEPFVVPKNWLWVRFGGISINRDGERIPVSSEDRQKLAKTFDYYGASGVIDKIDGYLFDKTLLLIGEDGANLINRATPIAFLAKGKYWVNNHAHVIDTTHPGLMEYLCLFINAISLGPYITGTAQPKMNQAKLNSIPVALPPLAEQHRIVARVKELMKLCDAMEQNGRLADEQHARLTSTLSDALAASESAHALAENWQRVAEHFDLLLDRPETIDEFEQIIIQLAIQGMLIQQNESDEVAASLLARIRAERDGLIAKGQARKDRLLANRNDDEYRGEFVVPKSWTWTRFGTVVLESQAGWSPNCEGSRRTGNTWGVLKVSAVSWGEFRSHENKELPANIEPRPEYEVQNGDFLISRANTAELVARSVVVSAPEPRLMLSDKIIRLHLSSLVNSQFFNIVNNSKMARKYYAENASGTSSSMKNVGREVILNMPVSIPPLAEQHRIVARVEELRRLCADLRQRLTQARETQSRLADALVAEIA